MPAWVESAKKHHGRLAHFFLGWLHQELGPDVLPGQFFEPITLSIHLYDDHFRRLCGMRGEIRGKTKQKTLNQLTEGL